MEIESFEDAASATESAFSMLSGAGELNIITAVRLRPMSSAEKQKGYRRIVDMAASEGGNWVRIVNPVALAPTAQYTPQQQSLRSTASSQRASSETPHFPPQFTQEFHFDHTFWSFDRNAEGRSVASQSTIYDELGLFTIENALLGYNCSIFAYGQTSAGKTYTMMGSEVSAVPGSGDESTPTTARRGLISRICRGLFDRLTEESSLASDLDYSVHVSYIEIYHERAYDLLAQALATNSSNSSMAGKESLKVRESPETGVYVEHANQVRVTSFEDIKVIIDEGNRVRSVAATSANQRSSRSHAVLTLYLKQTTTSSSTTVMENGAHAAVSSSQSKKSKICLVDLAGSERPDVSGANGARLREAGSINKSLATLADVISALSKRHQQPQELFVPYRNSILTRLLKESLGGNAKTIMLAAISPCCAHYDESLSTLKYIERAKSVVNVNVRVNAIEESCGSSSNGGNDSLDMVESLRREIEELKAQLRPSCVAPAVPSSIEKHSLTLQLDDRESGDDSAENEQLPASECLKSGEPQQTEAVSVGVESPLYATSLCFGEKEKATLEREVAKLKAQLRKKEREFQQHEATSKALSDKVSAQVLKQQAHVINLLGLHSKFVGMAKLRALTRWRFNVMDSSKAPVTEPSKPEGMVVVPSVPGADKYVMTDSENNEHEEIRGAVASDSVKCPARGRDLREDEENPACSVDDDAEVPLLSKPGLKKNASHGANSASLFPQLDPKQQRAFSAGGAGQVDVICSSIVTDFFGDTTLSSSLLLSTKNSNEPELGSTAKKYSNNIAHSGDNNQLSPEDPSDDIALEIETDDDEDACFGVKAAALIDEIIDHEAESNQVHEATGGADGQLKLQVPDELSDEDFGEGFGEEDSDDNDDEESDAELDSPNGSSSSPKASKSQRVQSKLARCLDAIDIARKVMGPTVRKLKQLTDKRSLSLGIEHDSGFLVGTGMERQLLIHADKSLTAVSKYVADLDDTVALMTDSSSSIKVSLYDKFEGLLSDFCLQTLGHVCDGLTSGAAGTCALARGHIEKQIEGFQTEVKELVSLALGSRETAADTETAGLLVSSLMELFGLGERIKFAWYAIDQKNRQRLAHFQSQQQFVIMASSSSSGSVDQQQALKTQAMELQAQYDGLLARFEAQTNDFAKREEEDRLALLLSTHKLEQEHEARVCELEQQLEASHVSITELEEHLLAQASRVELLEQELELTAVVRSTNELLLQHHHHGESGGGETAPLSLSASSSPSSSIIVKLEEELASALIQINELEANKDSVAADILHSSRRSSFTDGAEVGADGEVANASQEVSFNEACSTLADREMLEYMERTSEIEKQNNEAISKLNAAMGERRQQQQQHLSSSTFIPAVASDLTISSLEEGGRTDATIELVATVARLKQELETALARADALEDQHLKLMVSLEHQTDTVLHLEEELYEVQERGRQAEDSAASLQERVNTLEQELNAAQELADSLKQDVKDVMSELCVTECKCAQLEASNAELRAVRDVSEFRVKNLEAQLLKNDMEADNRVLVSEEAVLAAEERCKELETVNALLENRCSEFEYAKTASMESEAVTSAEPTARADLEQRLAEVVAANLEREEWCRSLLEQQDADTSRLRAVQEQFTLAQAKCEELEERWRLREGNSSEANSELSEELQAARVSNTKLTEELAELKSEYGSLQTQVVDLEVASVVELSVFSVSRELTTGRLEGELAASTQQLEDLLAVKQIQDSEVNSLTGELEATLERTLDLETHYADLHKAYDELKMSHEVVEAHCAELESTVTERLETSRSFATQVASLEQQLCEVTSQRVDLQLQLSDLRAQNADLKEASMEESSAARQIQDEQIHSSTRELETALEHSVNLETQFADLLMVYEELKASRDGSEARYSELETEGAAQLETIKNLETRLEQQLAVKKSKESELELQLSDLTAKGTELMEMIESLKTQVTGLEQQLSGESSQQTELNRRLSDLTVANAELQSQLANSKAERVALQRHTRELNAQQLELQEKCRFFRELGATRRTKVTALSEELRVAYAQHDQLAVEQREASDLTQSTQISELESQVRTISRELQSAETEKDKLSAADALHVARMQELEQECMLKTAAISALETERKEAITSCISLNNNISILEEQISSAKRGYEQIPVEHSALVASLELGLDEARAQIAMLQAASNQLELERTREAEHQMRQATTAASELELTKQAELVQAEHDTTKRHLSQLQVEFQGLTHSHEQAVAELQAELAAAHSRVGRLEAEVSTLQAQLQTAEESQRLLQKDEAATTIAHEAETQFVHSAQQERDAALAEAMQEFESKVAVLEEKCESQTLGIRKLEQELASAKFTARQSEEALDSQTLQLAEVEESFAVANARAHALENLLQETKENQSQQLEQLREGLLAESEAQLVIVRHAGAENSEANAARVLGLERQLSEKCAELDRVTGEFEIQMSMAGEHLEAELSEASRLAKHWEEQHTARKQEIQALQCDFEAKIALLDAEMSERELDTQGLRKSMERSQSSHSAELKQQESRHNATVSELRQETERNQALARDWELKYQELNACVSPEAAHKVRAQIEEAKKHAAECEATYRVELENKLQLEFDLASAKKELHVTKQQLVEFQCKELELNIKDPSGAVLRSRARQNELAAMENERQEVQEKLAQVARREASVKRLEASANARFEGLEAQHQKRVQELEASSKADQTQALRRIKDLEAQLTELTQKVAEVNFHSDSSRGAGLVAGGEELKAEQAQALLCIKDLNVQVAELSQKLVEANCRGDMQGEELHSFRSWSALQELLSADVDAVSGAGYEDASCTAGGKKKLSPEARRLVLKHLNSLDTWFERAILGKTSSDAGRSERRASLLAILESSDHGFTNLVASQERNANEVDHHQSEDDDDEHDDGCIDASDGDAVPVELDDLGDELLAMCSVDNATDRQQQQASANNQDFDALFDQEAALRQAQVGAGDTNRRAESAARHDTGESGNARLQAGGAAFAWNELGRPSTNPFDSYYVDARDGLSEVAQLR